MYIATGKTITNRLKEGGDTCPWEKQYLGDEGVEGHMQIRTP